jgi:hypothetical protein
MTNLIEQYSEAFQVGGLDGFREFLASRPTLTKSQAHIPRLWGRKNEKRTSIWDLRWTILEHVDSMARDPNYDREKTFHILRNNYDHFMLKIRKRKCDEVPSDSLRKDIQVYRILDVVDARREQLGLA